MEMSPIQVKVEMFEGHHHREELLPGNASCLHSAKNIVLLKNAMSHSFPSRIGDSTTITSSLLACVSRNAWKFEYWVPKYWWGTSQPKLK